MTGKLMLVLATAAMLGVQTATADPGQWSVTGSGVGSGGVAGDHVELGAHSDAGGANPRGHAEAQGSVNLETPRYNAGGDVVCVNVAGNKALVVWAMRQPIVYNGFTYTYYGAYIEDNGEPVNGQPVDRMVDFISGPVGMQYSCTVDPAQYAFAGAAEPLQSGNFVIDAG